MSGESDRPKISWWIKFVCGLVLISVWMGLNLGSAQAASNLTIAWAPSANTNVVGYKVYYGTVSHKYVNVVVGNMTNAVIPNIVGGISYYIAATTYNAAGVESAFSSEISYAAPVVAPKLSSSANQTGKQFSFSIANVSGVQCVVEASTNLVNWVPLQTNTTPFVFVDTNAANFKQRYYRTVGVSTNGPAVAPVLAPKLSTPAVQVGKQFSFSVTNIAGLQLVVEASTNLVNWVPLQTNTTPFVFVDTNAANFKQRYYRTVGASTNTSSSTPVVAPVITPKLSLSAVQVGKQFSFSVTNLAGVQCVIQASTNLVDWIPVQTNTTPFTFVDTNASSFKQRFYRTVGVTTN